MDHATPHTLPAPVSGAHAHAQAERRSWGALVLLAIAQFMVILDVTVVNVALPSIGGALRFARDDLQWVITAYVLFTGGLMLLGGRLGDLLGARRVFAAGLVVFTGASLLSGLAWSPAALVAARAVQGVGAALLSPAALALLQVTFSAGRERNLALGIWGALAGIGGTLGVVAGGILVDSAGWEWIFFVNVPVAIGGIIAAPRFLTESRG
jgi:MFS family permease